MNPIILIVEDHDTVRRSLREWLKGAFSRYQVIEASTGEQAVEIARTEAPCAVVMDISLPGVSGIEATRQIKVAMPNTQVVILTIHEEEAFRADAATAGASAYVTKRKMQKDLLPTLAAVLATQEKKDI